MFDEPYAIYDFVPGDFDDLDFPGLVDVRRVSNVTQSGEDWLVGTTKIAKLSGGNWQYYLADETLDPMTVPDVQGSGSVSLPPMISANVRVQNINDVGPVQFLANNRADAGWSHATNGSVFTFTGSPDRVHISCMVSFRIRDIENIQRPAPIFDLYRNGQLTQCSARTGYIRDATDHEEASATIAWTDPAPGINPSYEIRSRRDTLRTNSINCDRGHFTAEAVLPS